MSYRCCSSSEANPCSYSPPVTKAINELGLVIHGVADTSRDTGESLMRLRVMPPKVE